MARDFVTEPSPFGSSPSVSPADAASVSSRGLSDGAVTDLLQAAQKPERAYLWIPADAITFTPAVLTEEVFGDGRALFALTTINNRPAYWIFRGCSSWRLDFDYEAPGDAPEIADHIEDVVNAIDNEFGCADIYERNSRGAWVDPDTHRFVPRSWVEYPVIDASIGYSWSRLDWPDLPGVELEQHPFARSCRILARPAPAGEARQGQDAQRLDPKDDHAVGESRGAHE